MKGNQRYVSNPDQRYDLALASARGRPSGFAFDRCLSGYMFGQRQSWREAADATGTAQWPVVNDGS